LKFFDELDAQLSEFFSDAVLRFWAPRTANNPDFPSFYWYPYIVFVSIYYIYSTFKLQLAAFFKFEARVDNEIIDVCSKMQGLPEDKYSRIRLIVCSSSDRHVK